MASTALTSFTIVLFAVPFIAAFILSNHRALGPMRNSALNPLLLIAFFVFLAGVDFVSFAAQGYGILGSHVILPPPGAKFVMLVTKYAGMLLAFLSGIAVVFALTGRPRQGVMKQPIDMRGFLVAAHLVILLTWFVLISANADNFFSYVSATRTHLTRVDDPFVYATGILLLPAMCYALPKQSYKIAVPLVLFTLFIVFFSGARARLLYAIVPFVFYLVIVRGVRLPRRYFLIGILAVTVLAIAAQNLRIITSSGVRTFSAERVFDIDDVVNSNDLAIAEVNIALSKIGRARVNEYPGENLVSFATAPLPREILPFKPLSGSVQFTSAFDPSRWRSWGSALTIGAVNEIEYDYPYPLAVLVIMLFGSGWAAATVKTLRSASIHRFAWTVALYIFLFNFFRNDLFIAGGALWVFVFYWVTVELYRLLKTPASRLLPQATPPAEDNRAVAAIAMR